MGAALYLSFVLLVFCLVRAAGSQLKDRENRLGARDVPEPVLRAARSLARGIVIDAVTVAMDGPDRVCYRISGRLPDGKAVRVEVPGVGVARWLPDTAAEPVLPAAARRRLRRALPSFRPEAGTVRVTRQAGGVWFALDGRLADGRRAHLVISPDGRSLFLTVSDARSGRPPGAGTHALSG
ncbi:MAG: hypothetical protein AB7U59_13605 [Desulfovibrionaceae bacterium]